MAAVTAFRTMFSPHLRKQPDIVSSGSGGSSSSSRSDHGHSSSHTHRSHTTHHSKPNYRHSHPPATVSSSSSHAPKPRPTAHAMSKAEHVEHSRDKDYRHAHKPDVKERPIDAVVKHTDTSHGPHGSSKLAKGSSPALRVNDFELLKTLGTGTFARVWLARLRSSTARKTRGGTPPDDKEKDRVFALKILRKADVVRLKQVEHVRNERETLSAVSTCPFVPSLITTFADPDALYMLLDYCPGGEVFTYLRRAARFPEPTARFYAAEIVLVLEHLHEHGIAYRDLKPENMLLDAHGHLKLVDFGFAKMIGKSTYPVLFFVDEL